MKYEIRRRINPLTEDKKAKYYARPFYEGVIDIKTLSKDISDASTVNTADVKGVIEALLQVIPKYIKMGNIVKAGDLGNFKISFSSEGKDKAEDISSRDITGVKIIFTPSVEFKNSIKDINITKK